MYCSKCGAEINDEAVVCVKCGCAVKGSVLSEKNTAKWVVCLLLCLIVGSLGIHRFYVGKVGTGIIQLLTLGGFGIWCLIDLIMIALGEFTDKDDRAIKPDF